MEDFSMRIREEIGQIEELLVKTKDEIPKKLAEAVRQCRDRMNEGGRLFFLGNGGSAADAQHLACEFVVRYQDNRRPISAFALNVNSSIITAAGNDYGFDQVFSRQVQAECHAKDILFALSTSGESENVIKAVGTAKEKGVLTIAFTGKGGGRLAKLADLAVVVPSDNTPRIQEIHIALGHIFCGLIEEALEIEKTEC